MRIPIFSFVVLICLPGSVYCQTFQTNGSWDTGSNWSTGVVPSGTGTDVIISASPTISASNTIGNVTDGNNVTISVQSGGTLTLGSSALFGAGTSKSMTFNNNGTVQITSGGVIEIWGDLVVNNNLTLQVTGSLIVHGNIVMANNGVLQVSGAGSVSVTGNFTGGNNSTLQVSGTGSTLSVGGTLALGGGTSAIQTAGGGTITAGSCSCIGCSGSSGCAGNVLPVTLLFLKGQGDSEKIELQWATASEINFYYFKLQRSNDGLVFKTIGTIDGHGTTNEMHSYQFEDGSPVIGSNYYRLESVDFDGFSQVFNAIEVKFSGERQFYVYPNPTNGLSVNMSLNVETENAPVFIYNGLGQVISEVIIHTGDQEVHFPSSLAKGIYYAKLVGNGFSRTVRFVVI